MAASPSPQTIRKGMARMARQYPGATLRVIRASNGEVAIVFVLPCGTLTATPPASNGDPQ